MKRRDFKNFAQKEVYHVYNRGTNKENIFRDKQDYRAFLYRLGLAIGIKKEILNKNEIIKSPKSRVRMSDLVENTFNIHAFCLMPNHFHLLIEQRTDISISLLIQKICTSFSMYINKKYKRVGHLFQGNFKSVRIETNPQFLWTVSYIHMNPVKSKLVVKPEDYEWSSYRDYANDRNLVLTNKNLVIESFENKENLIKQTSKVNMSRLNLDI